MPLPNPKVITALIESYISIRMDDKWKNKLKDKQFDSDEIDKTIKQKLDICGEVLTKLKKIDSNMDAWLDFTYFLYEKDQKEDKEQPGNILGGIFKSLFQYPLLWSTLHAIIGYINSQLSKEKEFDQVLLNLEKREKELVKAIVEDKERYMPIESIKDKEVELDKIKNKIQALSVPVDYPYSHIVVLNAEFKKSGNSSDENVKDLIEKDFTSYVAKIENGHFNTNYCNELLESMSAEKMLPHPLPEENISAQLPPAMVLTDFNPFKIPETPSSTQIMTQALNDQPKPAKTLDASEEKALSHPQQIPHEQSALPPLDHKIVIELPKLRRSPRNHPGSNHPSYKYTVIPVVHEAMPEDKEEPNKPYRP